MRMPTAPFSSPSNSQRSPVSTSPQPHQPRIHMCHQILVNKCRNVMKLYQASLGVHATCELVSSLSNPKIEISADCCSVVKVVEENCLAQAWVPYINLILPLNLQQHCKKG
uniref:Prolamin-like domain-containing protein n=1 Tax=Populus trichocarpa TaxID=3694 RepID=U5G989_POPTR